VFVDAGARSGSAHWPMAVRSRAVRIIESRLFMIRRRKNAHRRMKVKLGFPILVARIKLTRTPQALVKGCCKKRRFLDSGGKLVCQP